ncbi:MAG TPA: hypothetical protein VFU59_03920, partial [Candidatus Eisenbacteria bacterium]|nr:hypothetical protein [Candidatus Eisenbacteria bacterium]
LFSAPWEGLGGPSLSVVATGLCGFLYSVVVLRRALRQRDYKPVLEDWIWHAALPILAYAAFVYAGFELWRRSIDAPFIIGGATLLLVFIGIHNAWDTVTYVATDRSRRREHAARRAPTPEPTP